MQRLTLLTATSRADHGRSSGDFDYFAGPNRAESLSDLWDQWPQVFDAIADVNDDYGRDADFYEILLISQLAVGCQDDAETRGHRCSKQNAISETQPSLIVHCDGIAAGQFGC